MIHEERIRHLEEEVQRLKQREKTHMHDISIYKEVFTHIKHQFEQLKKELLRK